MSGSLIVKGAICNSWPPAKFTLKTGLYISTQHANCCQQQLLLACQLYSQQYRAPGDRCVNTTTGALDWDELGLAGQHALDKQISLQHNTKTSASNCVIITKMLFLHILLIIEVNFFFMFSNKILAYCTFNYVSINSHLIVRREFNALLIIY